MAGNHIAAIVVAAGRGVRAGAGVPKPYRSLAGRPVLARALDALAADRQVEALQCVIHPDDAALYGEAVAALPPPTAARLLPPVPGGATRRDSVRSGLEALASTSPAPDLVLVHDGARPFPSPALVGQLIAAAREGAAAVPGLAVTDTIKMLDDAGRVAGTPDRARLRAVQTPQAFAFTLLLDAHRRAAAEIAFTDDSALMEWAGHTVHVVEGDPGNVKLTLPEDFEAAERRLAGPPLETRVGFGYDVHAFGPGAGVALGGLAIPHDAGLVGHSDADVALHALTDAILGALSLGDIGDHFPPSDPQWRGAASDRFLAFAVERMRQRGGRLDHLDLTIVCEAPRIGPHREAMRVRIAAICGISPSRVAVKATTSERLGFTGRREGIVAQAVATLRLPAET